MAPAKAKIDIAEALTEYQNDSNSELTNNQYSDEFPE
jgi:hypothetical protein